MTAITCQTGVYVPKSGLIRISDERAVSIITGSCYVAYKVYWNTGNRHISVTRNCSEMQIDAMEC